MTVVTFCRYASLYFCCGVEQTDNELMSLEVIHRYVELLDKYFGSVSQTSGVISFVQILYGTMVHMRIYTYTIIVSCYVQVM